MSARRLTKEEYAQLIAALKVERGLMRPVIHTNASLNRIAAQDSMKAGANAEEIADRWPEVFCLVDGKLGQLYDYTYGDGETYETKRVILRTSVNAFVKRLKARAKREKQFNNRHED